MSVFDAVVVNYRTNDLLESFLESFLKFSPEASWTLTVVDVQNDNDKFRDPRWKNLPTVDNCGYARACNLAATQLKGEFIGFFNADTRFDNPHCIDRCIEFMQDRPHVGIVGPLQYNSDNEVTHGGFFGALNHPLERGFKSPKKGLFYEDRKAVTVAGSAFFVRRSVWDELTDCEIYQTVFPGTLGAFLPTSHYYEETGCAYHAQAHGHEVWYLGSAHMVHEWHKSAPVGTMASHVGPSKALFTQFCDAHGIDHP